LLTWHLKAFDDKPLLGRSLLVLAKLSQNEAQYDEAINLCHLAQVCINIFDMLQLCPTVPQMCCG